MTHQQQTALISGTAPLSSLMRVLAHSRGRLLLAFAAFAIKDCPFWVLPVVTANIIDVVVQQGLLSQLWLNAALGVAVIALNLPSNALFIRMYSTVVRDLGAELRNSLAHRLQELSIGFHTRSSSSVVQTKMIRDVENVELMLQQTFGPILSAIGILIGAGVMTALRAPAFVSVFALTVPLAVALMRWLKRRTGTRNEAFRRQIEMFSSSVGEMASLLPITRAHGLEQVAINKVSLRARDIRDAGIALDRLNGRFGALSWMSFQLLGMACLVGAASVSITGLVRISPGDVVLFSTYFTILTGSIVSTFALAPIVTRGRESLRSIAEVLEDPDLELNAGKGSVEQVTGKLQFIDTVFEYKPGEAAVRKIDLAIEAGETVAFVGPSGSGKSTILNLAMGFLRPTAGRIELDGVDMEKMDLRTARRFVSVVPQESVLFEGTIRDNVTYGLGHVPDRVVREALQNANATEFVDALPDGWDTLVGERGSRISGGQRQRIAIARALVRDPKVLLLDEATSALDPESEVLVREALRRLMQGRTTLVVAHRLSTIRYASRIVVLENGSVVETGNHDELLVRRGAYWRMHNAQKF